MNPLILYILQWAGAQGRKNSCCHGGKVLEIWCRIWAGGQAAMCLLGGVSKSSLQLFLAEPSVAQHWGGSLFCLTSVRSSGCQLMSSPPSSLGLGGAAGLQEEAH